MIQLLFTGGTISMRYDADGGGNVPRHGGSELLTLAQIRDADSLRLEDWSRLPACHLTQTGLWALRQRVAGLIRAGDVDGIVITHGTDLLEETAYLLARTLPLAVPIVLTGAMRTADSPDWDGARNLRDAITVAGAAESRGIGAVVVFSGMILGGLDAVKMQATDMHAFGTPYASPIGSVSEGRVVIDRRPADRRAVEPEALGSRIAQVAAVLGDDGALLECARDSADGVVLVGFGSGNVPPGMVRSVGRWIDAGKPVVLASRCAYGAVDPAYAFEGGGAQLVRLGVVPAGSRSPSQARMELVVTQSARVAYGWGL